VRVDPLRCMRGGVVTPTPTNNAAVSLYNNSPAPHLISVLGYTVSAGGSGVLGTWVMQGRLATQNSGFVTPLVTGEAVGPGQIDNDDLGSFPPIDYFTPQTAPFTLSTDSRYPLAVLKPGWSFVAGADQGGSACGVTFIWEWLLAEEFYRRNPDIVLEEILASLKG
jgi:hypothetical protein